MDIEFVRPFVDGVIQVLKVQFNCACRPLAPMPKGKWKERGPIDIAGVVGLKGQKFSGSVALSMPAPVFLKFMSTLLGENYVIITPDIEDGAGEMLNMIFGHAKTILNEKGYSVEKAIPTVVTGQNLVLKSMATANTLVMPFQTEYGTFYLEIASDAFSQS